MTDWVVETLVLTTLLAAMVAVAGRVVRLSPALRHALWLVVLVRFLMPPILPGLWSVQDVRDVIETQAAIESRVATEPQAALSSAESTTASSGPRGEIAALRSEFVEPQDASAEEMRIPAGRAHRRTELAGLTPPSRHSQHSPASLASAGPDRVSATSLGATATLSPPASKTRLVTATLAAVWLLGAIAFLVRETVRWRRLVRLLASARHPNRELRDRVQRAAASLGLRPPRIRVLPASVPPFVALPFRPVLALPDDLLRRVSATSLDTILLHELSHLRRRDHWVALVALAGGCVWWWNPIFWFVRRRVDEHAELACDAVVVASRPDWRRIYAETLIEVTRQWTAAVPSPAPVGMVRPARRAFRRRLTMILNDTHRSGLTLGGALLIITFAAAAASGQGGALVDSPPAVGGRTDDTESSSDAEAAGAERNAGPLNGSADAPAATPAEPQLVRPDDAAPPTDERLRKLEAQLEQLLHEVRRLRGPTPPLAAPMSGLDGATDAPGVGAAPFAGAVGRPDPAAGPGSGGGVGSSGPPPAAGNPALRPPRPPTVRQPGAPAKPVPRTAVGYGTSGRRRANYSGAVGSRVSTSAAAGEGVDIVGLGTALIDAAGERDIARVRYAELAPSSEAYKIGKIRTRTAERKLALLTSLARTALVAAEAGLQHRQQEVSTVSTLVKTGRTVTAELHAAKSRLAAAEARLQMLREIVASVR